MARSHTRPFIRFFALCALLFLAPPAGARRKPLTPKSYVLSPMAQLPDASNQEAICPDPQFGERRNEPLSRMCADMRKNQNTARHDSLKKDTDRLLELATELKQSVDKSTKDTLSLEVIKKAEEVEKLAKKVKEKMRG